MFNPPKINWPRDAPKHSHLAKALKAAEFLGNEAGLAYLHACVVAEIEIDAERADSRLRGAVAEFIYTIDTLVAERASS